ncbi:MAG: glucokinase [Gammaproteobacteria bacterium]
MGRSPIEGWLLADVGGTRTRLAFLAAGGTLGPIRVTANDGHPDLHALIESGLESSPKVRSRLGAALAVAAPVTGDAVAMTNRDWDFSIEGLGRALGLARLHVINDFTAIARSIPALAASDTVAIAGATACSAREGGPIGVLGPGTGLGVSGLIPCDRGYAALASEGGHVTLAPACEGEEDVVAMVRQRFGHASAERLVSGPGLVTLYECLRTLAGQETSSLCPEDVTALALGGSDPIAARALGMFFGFLGSIAGDLALTLGALGGIYLAGGILPRLADALGDSEFRERFVAKGRYRRYLESIPTHLIVHPCPALPGLCALVERP